MNLRNGSIATYGFSTNGLRILQCCVDTLEHPIITRTVIYMLNDKSLYWDTINPVNYNCMSFMNNRELWYDRKMVLITSVVKPHSLSWKEASFKTDDSYDMMVKRCMENYGDSVIYSTNNDSVD